MTQFQKEVAVLSKKQVIWLASREELLFGLVPLFIPFNIYFSETVSRLLWSLSHYNSQPKWWILFLWIPVYVFLWAKFPLFPLAFVLHIGLNFLAQKNIKQKLSSATT